MATIYVNVSHRDGSEIKMHITEAMSKKLGRLLILFKPTPCFFKR